MEWRHITKSESETIMHSWNEHEQPAPYVEKDYECLRNELIKAMELTLRDLGSNKSEIARLGYAFDLHYGLKVFSILNDNYGMAIRSASDDGVWRYLSMVIVPDIVYLRWGLNPSRYWKEPRRIWLKTIYWYIFLSWQGSCEKTYEILKGNTTDEVVQIVERSGLSGYRVRLCRYIMQYYGHIDPNKKKRTQQLFRRVMKLNTARIKVIEPSLIVGGHKSYVKELFEYFESGT